jgi:hypothetical protein
MNIMKPRIKVRGSLFYFYTATMWITVSAIGGLVMFLSKSLDAEKD